MTPWSPLARGRLTRGWDSTTRRMETDEVGKALYHDGDREIVEVTAKVAAERGVPMAQVALAWLLRQPGITSPIIGASRPEQLRDGMAALSLALSDEETAALAGPYTRAVRGGHLARSRYDRPCAVP